MPCGSIFLISVLEISDSYLTCSHVAVAGRVVWSIRVCLVVKSFSFQYLRYLIVTSRGSHVLLMLLMAEYCGLLECALWFNLSHCST